MGIRGLEGIFLVVPGVAAWGRFSFHCTPRPESYAGIISGRPMFCSVFFLGKGFLGKVNVTKKDGSPMAGDGET